MENIFKLEDGDDWMKQLETEGYVVVKGVLTQEQVEEARDLFWDWLEGLGSGISRTDPTTWKDENWPGDLKSGIITTHGAAHSKGMWFVRSVETVKQVFSTLWDEEDLATSLDVPIMWRPWIGEGLEGNKPVTEGLHMDQNPIKKPGCLCIQGMIPLFDVTDATGGLELVARSHLQTTQDKIAKAYPYFNQMKDFCQVRSEEFSDCVGLVECSAGDIVLWDSRVVHGGRVGTIRASSEQLVRCSVTVCMLPRVLVPEDVLINRKLTVDQGIALTHWPNEFNPHSLSDTNGVNIKAKYVKPELKPLQLDLL